MSGAGRAARWVRRAGTRRAKKLEMGEKPRERGGAQKNRARLLWLEGDAAIYALTRAPNNQRDFQLLL
jgi:hypothetical protein